MTTVLDCFRHWSLPLSSWEELVHADVIIQHEFGDQVTPSRATERLALCVAELAREFRIPVICQYPAEEVIRERGVRPFAVIRSHGRRPGAYLDTEEVNRQAAAICRRYGWQRAILCAHPDQLWRVAANVRHHGLTPLYADTGAVRYDPCSSRFALRYRTLFVLREVLARLFYVARGVI